MSEPTPEVLTAQEVVDLLRVRPSTVLDLARRAVPPSSKVGKHRRFLRAYIASWLEHQCLTPWTPKLVDGSGRRGAPYGACRPDWQQKRPRFPGPFWKRMKGLEPSTFCMARKVSDTLSAAESPA